MEAMQALFLSPQGKILAGALIVMALADFVAVKLIFSTKLHELRSAVFVANSDQKKDMEAQIRSLSLVQTVSIYTALIFLFAGIYILLQSAP